MTDSVEDELFEKYDLFDDEGYLVGTSHPNIIAVFERIEQLSMKGELTQSEIEEGEELISVQRAYTKAAEAHILMEMMDDDSDSDEYDSSFVVDDDDSEASDDYSYNSHRSECSDTSDN